MSALGRFGLGVIRVACENRVCCIRGFDSLHFATVRGREHSNCRILCPPHVTRWARCCRACVLLVMCGGRCVLEGFPVGGVPFCQLL